MSKFNWKKIIILLLIIIGLLGILSFLFLKYVEQTKTYYFDETKEFILKETDLINITSISFFQEEKSFYILEGEDKEKTKWVMFNPEKNKDPSKVLSYKLEELISQEQIENTWKKDCKGCTLKGSTIAMIDSIPLWELTYMNEQNQYVIEYISLKDAKTFEKWKLHREYQ